jgi:hypothetical protein
LEERKNHIDAQLKEKFQGFSPELPFQWDEMQGAMDKRSNKRRRILWATAAAVVITSISGLILEMSDVEQVNPPISEALVQSQKESTVKSSERKEDVTQNNRNQVVESQQTNSHNPKSAKQLTSLDPSGERNEVIYKTIPVASSLDQSDNLKDHLSSLDNQQSIKNWEILTSRSLEALSTSYGDNLQLFQSISMPQESRFKNRKWAFGVGYDQNQTALNYRIAENYQAYVHKNYLNRMTEGEMSLSAPQIQAHLSYDLTQRWSFSLGLGFTQTKTSQTFNFRDSIPVSVAQGEVADAFGNYPIFGYLGLGQQVDYSGVQTISMLSIPVGMSYRMPINKEWAFNSEATFAFNSLSASQGKTLNYHDLSLMEVDNTKLRSSVWSARLGIGMDYRVSRWEYIGMRLNTQGALNPLYKENSAIENRPWSVGVSIFYNIKLF